MTENFDPYHNWLGIRDPERPLNHYRLLGIELFEDDADVISNAADRQMAYVRTYQLGPHAELSQRILNELAVAKLCLLDPMDRADYDQGLMRQFKPGQKAAVPGADDTRSGNRSLSPTPLFGRHWRSVSARQPNTLLTSLLAAAAGAAAVILGLIGYDASRSPQLPAEKADTPALLSSPARVPSIRITRIDPAQPAAGGSVTIDLATDEIDGDPVMLEYRIGDDGAWQSVSGYQARIEALQPGKLSFQARGVTTSGAASPVLTQPIEVSADRLRLWDSVTFSGVENFNGILRLGMEPGIATRESYSGPIEITAEAQTNGKSIRLRAFDWAVVIFNWELNPRELRVGWPDGNPETAAVEPLKPNTWYTLKWRITETGMEVYVNDSAVFRGQRRADLSPKRPVRIHAGHDGVVDVKSLLVRRLTADSASRP